MDLPATHPNLSHFVYQSANGLPRLWHIKPMPMSRGQTWVFNSLTVHTGGGCPAGAPYRCVAFCGVAPFLASYEMTQGVFLPFGQDHPVQPLHVGGMGVG